MSERVATLQLPTTIDLSSSDKLRQKALEAGRGQSLLILDCVSLEFVDSTGIKMLLMVKEQLGADGCQVRLDNIQAEIAEIFDLLGVTELFAE